MQGSVRGKGVLTAVSATAQCTMACVVSTACGIFDVFPLVAPKVEDKAVLPCES